MGGKGSRVEVAKQQATTRDLGMPCVRKARDTQSQPLDQACRLRGVGLGHAAEKCVGDLGAHESSQGDAHVADLLHALDLGLVVLLGSLEALPQGGVGLILLGEDVQQRVGTGGLGRDLGSEALGALG